MSWLSLYPLPQIFWRSFLETKRLLERLIWVNCQYPLETETRKSTFLIEFFYKHTKLAILALLPTLYSNKFTVSFFICSFFLYLWNIMLANTKLDITGHHKIIFQVYRLYWSSCSLIGQLKQSWQYCHSCIAETLWKTLVNVLGK